MFGKLRKKFALTNMRLVFLLFASFGMCSIFVLTGYRIYEKPAKTNQNVNCQGRQRQPAGENLCRLSVSTPLITSDTLTDLSTWDFKRTVNCPYIDVKNISQTRQKAILDCSSIPSITHVTANIGSDVFQVEFGDDCLKKVIDQCCTDTKPVPNVIHYINYGKHTLGYFQFLSYISVLRFMKPCLFLIHGDFMPSGELWDYFLSIYPNVIHVKRELVTSIYGHKLAYKEHGSDVMRIEAIQMYGGAYIDWDQVFLRPVEPLRQYDFVQSLEEAGHFTNGVLFGKRNATFLNLWHQGYKNYTNSWGGNSLFYPFHLAKKYPKLIHVEGYNFTRPHFGQLGLIFNKNYDWSTNYATHLFIRMYKRKTDMEIIRKLNTTIGSVSRHVLFGNKELCSN